MSSDARPRLSVRFYGVRGSMAMPREGFLETGGNTSCVAVRAADGTTLVLDAGTGIRDLGIAMVADAGGAPLDVHVLLSHYHWDHIQGLPFFAPLYGDAHRVTFVAVEGDGDLGSLLRGQMAAPYFPVPFGDLAATVRTHEIAVGETLAVGPMRVRPFPVHHTQAAHGYRIEAGGAVLVYATDFEHGDAPTEAALVDAARDADLLICDAQYTAAEYELREGWGHTTWEHATRLAAEAGVAELALFHHDPSHDDAALARILARAQERFAATRLAVEGETVEL